MTVRDEVSWALGEIADHPGRLSMIFAMGVMIFVVIYAQTTVMPWDRSPWSRAPTVINSTIIKMPGQPDRVVVQTSRPSASQPRPKRPETQPPGKSPKKPRGTLSVRPDPAPTQPKEPLPSVSPKPSPKPTTTPPPAPSEPTPKIPKNPATSGDQRSLTATVAPQTQEVTPQTQEGHTP